MKYLSIDLGIKNLGVCVMTLPDHHASLELLRKRKSKKHPYPRNETFYDFMKQSTIDLWSLDRVGHVWESMDFLVPAICKHVDELITKHQVDMLLIERQPAINKKTCILLFSLYAYFMNKIPVRVVHGGLKIKACKLIGLEKEELKERRKKKKTNKKENYDLNKLLAVEGCELLINEKLIPEMVCEHDGVMAEFKEMKKQDDVADALLQGLAFHIHQPKVRTRVQQKPPKPKVRKTRKRKAQAGTPKPKAKRRRISRR